MRWPWEEVKKGLWRFRAKIPTDNLEPESLKGDGRSEWGGWERSQDVSGSPDHLGGLPVTAPRVLSGMQHGNTKCWPFLGSGVQE